MGGLCEPFESYKVDHIHQLTVFFQVQARHLTNVSTTEHSLNSVQRTARCSLGKLVLLPELEVYPHRKVVVG